MRAIMVTPVAVSSSTQGRIDWLAYGWKRTISPHSTRNSTTTNGQHAGVLHREFAGGALEHLDERQRTDCHGNQQQRNLT